MLPGKQNITNAADRDENGRHRREAVEVWSGGRVARVLMLHRNAEMTRSDGANADAGQCIDTE